MGGLDLREACRHVARMQLALDMYCRMDEMPERLLDDVVAAERELDVALLVEHNLTQLSGLQGPGPGGRRRRPSASSLPSSDGGTDEPETRTPHGPRS